MSETTEGAANPLSPDLVQMRGEVIGRFAMIEAMIDSVITAEYVRDPVHQEAFVLDVLADEGFSFALKRNLLGKVVLRHGWNDRIRVQTLSELGNIRNEFAHAGKFWRRGGAVGIVHPRDPRKFLDLDARKREFDKKCEEITPILVKLANELFPEDHPDRVEVSLAVTYAKPPASE